MNRIPVAIAGATGFVGLEYLRLLSFHPWFEVRKVCASAASAGKVLGDILHTKGFSTEGISPEILAMTVGDLSKPDEWQEDVRAVFSAFNLDKETTAQIEETYAAPGLAVISNNSAHRSTEDIPVVIPEVNADHLRLIEEQRRSREWGTGCIVCKPNCSIQSFVPVLKALWHFRPEAVVVQTFQAISGAGKTLEQAPEIQDNVMPLSEEARKAEKEPLKILGTVGYGLIDPAELQISAQAARVPVSDGHMVNVFLKLADEPSLQDVKSALQTFKVDFNLPSSPEQVITLMEEKDRPQTRHDRDRHNGMGISVGQVEKCAVLGFKMSTLSHNLARGAAGGAVLTAELLVHRKYLS